MASFDLVTAAGNAYIKTWNEREYLFRMAIIPLLVKFTFYAISVFYFGTDNIIRLSLVMLPAYFVEGWLLAHWVRTIVLDHRWPFQPTGNEKHDMKQIQNRGRGIMSSTLAFTLINFLMAGFFAFFMSYIPLDADPQTADPKIAMVGILMMAMSFVLFRFVWLYVPLAVNEPLEQVFQNLKSLRITFSMIGVWLVCFVPAIMVLQVLSAGLSNMAGENPIPLVQGVIMFLRVFLDTVKDIICTAGMAYAFIELFGWKKKKA